MNARNENLSTFHSDRWYLFLDRDGVINRKIENGYVTGIEEFEFLPNVLKAIAQLSSVFEKIFIVTNQRGIALGLYTEQDLSRIHAYLSDQIQLNGGKIDGIYFCPHDLGDNCECRKPKPGLIIQAKEQHSEISFDHSILVGDSESDISAGKSLGMKTVLIDKDKTVSAADHKFQSLYDFCQHVKILVGVD
jgi:D-glycero-D-manno-heptose 1,7-bisphosphate phosphatase